MISYLSVRSVPNSAALKAYLNVSFWPFFAVRTFRSKGWRQPLAVIHVVNIIKY